MDLGEILRVMRKRWYLMAPVMVLTIALTALAYFLLPTKYESTSTVSLLTAERASIVSKSGNTNPYLVFDSSLVATADFLSRSLSSKGSQEELKGMGVSEEYTVALADNAQGPFISIVVDGDNKSRVLHSTSVLTDYASQRLTSIQSASGVKPEDMIRLTIIIPPQTPVALIKNKLQSVIAVAGVGTALAFIITFVTEGLSRSRRAAGAAGPMVTSVRSVASSVPPSSVVPGAVSPTNGFSPSVSGSPGPSSSEPAPDETAVTQLPAQRIPTRTTGPGEKTQIVINGTSLPTKTAPVSKTPPAKQAAPDRRPVSSATVYRSNATNGKSHDDGDKSQQDAV
jgi:capsular polysaccharide biosynthesis protein